MYKIQLLVCKARSVALPLTYFGNYMAILTMLKPPNATITCMCMRKAAFVSPTL
jgi:hypothetical protein